MEKKKKPKIKVSIQEPKNTTSEGIQPIDHLNEKEFGTIRLTTNQLPEIAEWQIGNSYNLNLTVRQVETRERQETKWDDKKHEDIKVGEPYFESEFRITSVSTGDKPEKKPDLAIKVSSKKVDKSEDYEDNS